MGDAVEVYYSGQVQGVGFRYTTQRIARRYEVVGFVANLPDGRVHLFAEGARPELQQFLREVGETLGPYIASQSVSWGRPRQHLTTFEIRQ